MLKSLFALSGTIAVSWCAAASAQQTAPVPRVGVVRAGHQGLNAGTLSCTVAGGSGFIFRSSKMLSCIFARPDGLAERYEGEIKRFGVDIGFTKDAQVIWLVFAPGVVAPGALAGNYAGAAVQAALGAGMGSNVLTGGSNKQISLQPVSVAGAEGLNMAGGLAEFPCTPPSDVGLGGCPVGVATLDLWRPYRGGGLACWAANDFRPAASRIATAIGQAA